jgi:hypothetical protein
MCFFPLFTLAFFSFLLFSSPFLSFAFLSFPFFLVISPYFSLFIVIYRSFSFFLFLISKLQRFKDSKLQSFKVLISNHCDNFMISDGTHIIWSENICPSLTRWDLELAFHGSISAQYAAFGKLNRSNWIWLCCFLKNYLSILDIKIR